MKESRKRQLLVLLVCVTIGLVFLAVSIPETSSAKIFSLWLANVLGYSGIILLLWMYILGTRSVMGIFFKDLSPVLKIHKWLGKYGALAIALHPLLIVFNYGESLLYTIIPQLGSEFERHVTLGRMSFWIIILIWITSAILRDKIKFRPWKYIHYLAYISLPFALLHVPDVGSNYMAGGGARIYYFLLVVVFLIFSVLRLRGFLNLDKSEYRVVSNRKLTESDYLLTIKPLGDSFVRPLPGQYIYLTPGIISESHPFSVLSYDEKSGQVAICYRVFGSFTRFLTELEPRSKVYIDGPYGSFMSSYKKDPRPAVFISGGIGITPFFDRIMRGGGKREQWLFAANRSHETAVLLPEIKQIIGSRLVPIFSREIPDRILAGEEIGYLSKSIINKRINDPLKYSFYICGPTAMMESTYEILENLGVPKSQIYSEEFGW